MCVCVCERERGSFPVFGWKGEYNQLQRVVQFGAQPTSASALREDLDGLVVGCRAHECGHFSGSMGGACPAEELSGLFYGKTHP